MGYPDSIKLHVTESMRATIESIALRRRREIETLLSIADQMDAQTKKPLLERATVQTLQEELFTIESIIVEVRVAGT